MLTYLKEWFPATKRFSMIFSNNDFEQLEFGEAAESLDCQ